MVHGQIPNLVIFGAYVQKQQIPRINPQNHLRHLCSVCKYQEL